MRRFERSWWWVKEKNQMGLFLIAITMILQFQVKECEGCLEPERIGLLQLKSYLNSLFLESWSDDDTNSDCCLWERVNCNDSIGGHIVDLSLSGILGMGASGSLNLSLLHSFPQLKTLDFSGNGFDHLFDPIHGYKSFQILEKLETLDLSDNFLNNSVLPFLSAAKSLKTLNLERNRMEGVFPPNELANMTELKVLNLYRNKFRFFSVQGVVFLSSLQVLKLGSNQLSSTLEGYSKICALKNLRELDLSENTLTSLPCCLGNLSHLRTLDLSKNQLNGDLSSFVYGLPSTLDYLSLLDNNFDGSFLCSLVSHTRLTVFKLSSKVGMIQAQAERPWVPLFRLKRLELRNFVLGSTIPSFLVHQHDLCYVDISYSQWTGAFPAWLLQNNTRLQAIFLNSNALTKLQLPKFDHGLQALDISCNMVQDSIQEDIGNVFPMLSFMNLSSNHFHGTIPSSIGEMKSLGSSNFLANNRDEAYQCDIHRDTDGLDLSSNELSGEIPVEIGNLHRIRSLNLSNNNLKSSIPDIIAKLKDLGSLDLSNNKLHGHIPPQLANLRLGYFNVSFNDLSGEVPLNGSFRSFYETSYIGNAHLCGVPTNKICNSQRDREQSEEEEFKVWFHWTFVGVYITTLLALSAFLYIDSRWSRHWFNRVDLSVHHLQRFKGRFVSN